MECKNASLEVVSHTVPSCGYKRRNASALLLSESFVIQTQMFIMHNISNRDSSNFTALSVSSSHALFSMEAVRLLLTLASDVPSFATETW